MPDKAPPFREIEEKWQKRWSDAHVYQADADPSRPKYFLTVPYPYMNGYLHIGFGVTFLHADIMARFKRMQGHNVLFPQSFHCTGMPVLAAANLVKEDNHAQIKILKDMGIPDEKIPEFADVREWTRYFPEAAKKDLQEYGASIDWRRTFITTDLDPAYNRFIEWQFCRLYSKGHVKRGKHPVIWCPKDKQPIADHDRYEGEGEIPVEFTLLKFGWREKFLIAATLRPETVFGQTNLWVDPDVAYVEASVDAETWILSRAAMEKLREQDRQVEMLGEVRGSDLIGQRCTAPMIDRQIPVLPTRFIDQTKGTGIVTSVPSDAPDDWIALKTLKEDEAYARKHNVDLDELRAISPIHIIRTDGWGPLPAVEVCERLKITSVDQRDLLEKAKDEVYSSGFYRGVMADSCGIFAGKPVAVAKEDIKKAMVDRKEASSLWESSGEVICRCRTKGVVKVVSDQWFLTYGDKEWKEITHQALKSMALHPETTRTQFEHVLDWLNDWACTHHTGLGTKLPWDDRWVIESLSDSTIYMAYYTISHLIAEQGIGPEKLTDDVLSHVFLGEGTANEVAKRSGLDVGILERMKREFEYWYPMDLRHSGKDLVQNHLAFCLFNHTAIFPQTHWPKAFGINGFVKIGDVRMSKSHGVALYLRDVTSERGADVVRLALAQGGEGLDDPSYDDDFAVSAGKRLHAFVEYAMKRHKTRKKSKDVDAWFRSVLHRTVSQTSNAMEGMWHRTAIKLCYFDLQRHWAWYLKRSGGTPHEDVLNEFLDLQIRMISPFMPHVAEELWSAAGNSGFVCNANYPVADEKAVDKHAELVEEYVQSLIEDFNEIVKVTGLKAKVVTLYLAPEWKRQVYELAAEMCLLGKPDMGDFMKKAMEVHQLKTRAKDVVSFAPKVLEILRKTGPNELEARKKTLDEETILNEAKSFLESELGCDVSAKGAEESGLKDPKGKARQAMPWKPAIYVE